LALRYLTVLSILVSIRTVMRSSPYYMPTVRAAVPIGDGINPEQVAGILTKRIRNRLLGDGAGFNREIRYPPGALP
jgi:hypothetical protein